jgi:predicted enzyme related to lactoylglutathione lyase
MKDIGLILVAIAAVVFGLSRAQAQSAPQANAAAPMPVKALAMMAAAIPSSDLDRSIAFYTKGLGMVSAGKVEMGSVTEAPLMFPGSGAYLMLQHPKTDGAALPARTMLNRIVLAVPDLKALQAQLAAAGYQLDGEIHEIAQYHVAVGQLEDPDGNHLELVQRTP